MSAGAGPRDRDGVELGAIAAQVGWLVDRAGVSDLVNDYASSIDLGQVERLDEVFTTDVVATYTGFEPIRGRAEVISWITSRAADLVFQHHAVRPQRIELDGDRGQVLVHLVSHQLRADGQIRFMASRYDLSVVRATGTRHGWQVERLDLLVGIDERRPG